ncbi:MAG: HAD family hydrolase [Candidatus Hinthialibacter antarcticus]|nr:HAD family hydrolase [Candidatus Hinthialibacter antarcticus]
MTRRRFAILDRDGTVIRERHYLANPDDVEVYPSAIEGIKGLQALGLGIVIVTNQSAVGRGIIDLARLNEIHQRMIRLLGEHDIVVDGIYFCPHHPEDECHCRKPKPGMVLQAAREHGFDPAEALYFGDKPCDIDLGNRLDGVTFLVRTGYGKEYEHQKNLGAHHIVDSINDAVSLICL